MKSIIEATSSLKRILNTNGIILWGAGPNVPVVIILLEQLNLKSSIKGIFDSTKIIDTDFINGIRVFSSDEIHKLSYDNNIVLACAGLNELYGYIVPEHLFYFRIIHRRALEFFCQLDSNSFDKIQDNIDLFTNDLSKRIYLKRIELVLSSVMFNSNFKTTGGPYFGNDILDSLNGTWMYAGAYNGKHLERAITHNCDQRIIGVEPSNKMFNFLVEKFKSSSKVEIHNKLLWSKSNMRLSYNDDSLHQGLAASIFQRNEFGSTTHIETTTVDDLVGDRKLSQLALDVEGSEQHAIKGATNTIQNLRDGCAVCIYHNLDDYLKIPQMLSEISSQKYLSIRQHSCIPFIETVLYSHN